MYRNIDRQTAQSRELLVDTAEVEGDKSTRQLVVLLPAAYLLSLSGKLSAVWYAYPIAEIVSVTVALLLFLRVYKRVLSRISDGPKA